MVVLTGIFLAVLSIIVLVLMQQGRSDDAQNIMVKIVIWTIYSGLEIKYDIQLPNALRVGVMAVIVSDSLFGLCCGLYSTSSIFDKVQHVLGTYAFALFAYTIIYQLSQPVMKRSCTFIFIVALGLAIGALYEISEFLGDTMLKPKIPSQTSLRDTDLDLMADLLGSLLAAVQATYISRNLYKR